MILSVIALVIVIAVCVIVHEYGHYITAKILGVQVHKFAFGMEPTLLTAHSSQPDSCPKFSIIVPVYNAEKYIAKCLDSLINQDMPSRNYEIIITDDGSTDSSGEICDSYADKYPFIHVTHTENHGAGHARNVAIPQCRGEYVTFCDADDYVSPCLIPVLTRAADVLGHPDVIVFRHYTSMDFPAEGFPVYDVGNMKSSDAEISDGEELCVRILRSNDVGGFTWNKLIKSELARGFLFDESLRVAMDHEWLLRLFASNRKAEVMFINYFLYCYVQVPDVGQTRNLKRVYGEGGMKNIILTLEKELTLDNLSPEAKRMTEGNIYCQALNTVFCNEISLSRETRARLMYLVRKYALKFYFRTSFALLRKVKMLVKHILTLFHIHKPRRK